MTSYTYGSYTFSYATYQSDNNPNLIVFWGEDYQYVTDKIVSDPMVDYYINTLGLEVRLFRPLYTKWDDVNLEQVVDNEQYTPPLKAALSTYRDAKILEQTMVIRTWNSENLGLVADARTIEAVGRKANLSGYKKQSETDSVNFKFSQYTESDISDAGFRNI